MARTTAATLSGTAVEELATAFLGRAGARGCARLRRGARGAHRGAASGVPLTRISNFRPNRSNPTGRINGWRSILNTLAITYGDRLNLNQPDALTQRSATVQPFVGVPG